MVRHGSGYYHIPAGTAESLFTGKPVNPAFMGAQGAAGKYFPGGFLTAWKPTSVSRLLRLPLRNTAHLKFSILIRGANSQVKILLMF